jgi:SSS family solute:Na+ symporter
MIGVSYMTETPDYERIKNLSFGTATAEYKLESYASWDWREVITTIFVIAVIASGYIYFTG